MFRKAISAAVLLTIAPPAFAQEAAMPGWLAGCWEQVDGDRWTEECWTYPRGGILDRLGPQRARGHACAAGNRCRSSAPPTAS